MTGFAETLIAWQRHVAATEARLERTRASAAPGERSKDGIASWGESLHVPSGTISDWRGAVFLPGISLDRLLRANPQYAYCRDLGQLRAPEVVHIDGDAHAQYLRHCERMNRRAGAVKLVSLDPHSGWTDGFVRRPELQP